jgi:multiple sugar transport system ATP-binding protein
MPDSEIKIRVGKIAEVLGIGHVLEKRPGFLSGGQKQRVSLGRAIIRPADIYLLDEPIGHLDAKLRHHMRAELKALAQDMKSTVVFTTTSSKEALGLGDRIVVLNQGRIQQVGTPEEVYRKPSNAFVATFVGDPPMSLIKVKARSHGGRLHLETQDDRTIGILEKVTDQALIRNTALRVGVRSSEITLVDVSARGAVPGEVSAVEHLGYANIAIVEVGGDQVSITTKPDQRLKHGEKVGLLFGPNALHLFDGEAAIHHSSRSI